MVGTKEFYDLMAEFEKAVSASSHTAAYRFDKEDYKNASAPAGYFYQDGHVNELFHAYMLGYQYGKNL